jgi:hypothetical protein
MTPTPLHVLCGAVLSGTSPPTQQNRTFTFYALLSPSPPKTFQLQTPLEQSNERDLGGVLTMEEKVTMQH